MAKYSFETKMCIVQEYIGGKGGYRYLAKKHGIPDHKLIQRWVVTYKKFGNDGIMRSRKNKTYTFDFKLNVVELYLTTEVSYQDLALQAGINNPPLITKWVNDYRIAGLDALKPKRKGRRRKMDKPTGIIPHTPDEFNNNAEYIKQLEDELLKLKIENAYLKELRRLRLEEIPQNKKRKSFTASEDHSN